MKIKMLCSACGAPWTSGHAEACPGPIGHGGKRAGAGRKALDDGGTIVTTIRLTGEQRATFDMLGGVEWLRWQLDKARRAT